MQGQFAKSFRRLQLETWSWSMGGHPGQPLEHTGLGSWRKIQRQPSWSLLQGLYICSTLKVGRVCESGSLCVTQGKYCIEGPRRQGWSCAQGLEGREKDSCSMLDRCWATSDDAVGG